MPSMYPFERFTDQAKQVLTRAQGEAERSHHSYIGTEHLLLGMFQVERAMGALILADLGVEMSTVRDSIKGVLGRNERIVIQQIIPTSRVKKVIEIAFEEARQGGSPDVGTQHLLLALLIEGDGIAANVLKDLGVTVSRVREATARLSAAGMHEGAASEAPPRLTDEMAGRPSPDPVGITFSVEDLVAVEMLAALLDRFGATERPPPSLLKRIGELRHVRGEKQEARVSPGLRTGGAVLRRREASSGGCHRPAGCLATPQSLSRLGPIHGSSVPHRASRTCTCRRTSA